MAWIDMLGGLLEGTMEVSYLDATEAYLTTPIADGAIEIENDHRYWWRRWDRTHGLADERLMGEIPLGPLAEQASYIRMMLKQEEMNRYLYCDNASKYLLACKIAQLQGEEINDNIAKAIAWDWSIDTEAHRTFCLTGEITSDNLWWEIFCYQDDATYLYSSMNEDQKLVADMLGTYLMSRRRTGQQRLGPVPNWSDLRL